MIIIGEKINGTRKAVARAIREKDATFIRELAKSQAEGGSTYLDVNAGTPPEREPDDMVWLVNNIQEVSALSLCLDSTNPAALRAGLDAVKHPPMINSVSGEQSRIEGVLPLALEYKTDLILLALDDNGIPETVEERMKIVHKLVGLAVDGGLEASRLHIDPLVTAISTGTENAILTYDMIRAIREAYPNVHITGGASNISFGMPLRPVINRYFMALGIQAGLDSAIIDPNNRELKESIMTAELLMGRDRRCLNFNRAFRAGKIGPKPE